MDHPSFEEIAKEMGITPQQAHDSFHSGLRKLKRNHPKTLQIMWAMANGLHFTPPGPSNEELD